MRRPMLCRAVGARDSYKAHTERCRRISARRIGSRMALRDDSKTDGKGGYFQCGEVQGRKLFRKKQRAPLLDRSASVDWAVVELAAMKAKLNEAEMALTATRSALEVIERSWSWKIGRAMTLPVRLLRNRFHKFHAD